ncbi:MAG: hypothetical protein HY253_01210 [Burkholderiales bacterium]|nr:hypothetical protein [Burkholderiales bacterium]
MLGLSANPIIDILMDVSDLAELDRMSIVLALREWKS